MARRAKASRAYCALLAIDIELVDHREAAGQARGDEDKRRRDHAVRHALRLQVQIMRVSGHGGHQLPYPRPAGLEQSPGVPYARVGRLGPAGKARGGREAKVKLAKRPTGAHSPTTTHKRTRACRRFTKLATLGGACHGAHSLREYRSTYRATDLGLAYCCATAREIIDGPPAAATDATERSSPGRPLHSLHPH